MVKDMIIACTPLLHVGNYITLTLDGQTCLLRIEEITEEPEPLTWEEEMADMQNFKKLSVGKQLESIKVFISRFPTEEQEKMVREILVRKEDQDQMLQELANDAADAELDLGKKGLEITEGWGEGLEEQDG